MSTPDTNKADFAALLKLAESKFYAWHLKKLRPERDRRLRKLYKQNLTSTGRAIEAFRIYRELLEREVIKRVGFYRQVAREWRSSEMLSEFRLDEYRQLIMTTVGHHINGLSGQVRQDTAASDNSPGSTLPNANQYIQLQAEILDVVNAELLILEAEGNLTKEADRAGATAPSGSEPARTESDSASPQRGDEKDRLAERKSVVEIEPTAMPGTARTACGEIEEDAIEDMTEDGPLGKNPYAKGHPKYEHWLTSSRYAKEEALRFNADHLKMMPAESEDWRVSTEWHIKGVVGRFDIQAKWLCIHSVWSYKAAYLYERGLKALVETTLARAREIGAHAGQNEYFISELTIRLLQRQYHWNAEAHRFAREAEEAKSKQGEPDCDLAERALAPQATHDAVPALKQAGEPTQQLNAAAYAQESTATVTSEDGSGTGLVAAERRALLAAFKAKARKQSIKVTDAMVAKAANPGKWNDRTMVTWWKRNDSNCKLHHDKKIRAVLNRDPSSIWAAR